MRTRASNCFDPNLDPEDSLGSVTIRDAFAGELPTDLSDLPRETIVGGVLAGIPEFVEEYTRRLFTDEELEELINISFSGD